MTSANPLKPIAPAAASRQEWDAVVLGAGPAGSIAARMLSSRGFDVLLVDKQNFPRPKVCGCCLNSSALDTLAQCGLGDLPESLNARTLTQMRIYSGGESATLTLPRNKVLSREAMDTALIAGAISSGASFLPATHATEISIKDNRRRIEIHSANALHTLTAKMLFVATGLNSTLLETDHGLPASIDPQSRIGVGTSTPDAPSLYTDHAVFMACGGGGYAGLVRLEDGRLNIAAALDVEFLRAHSNPGKAIAGLLSSCGLPPIQNISDLNWHGTPLLTRSRAAVSAERLLVLGDAAGYVEPFTGEGMAWAMLSGLLAARVVPERGVEWNSGVELAWSEAYRHLIKQRQISCRIISKILRNQHVSRAALGILEALPALGRWVQKNMEQPMVRSLKQ